MASNRSGRWLRLWLSALGCLGIQAVGVGPSAAQEAYPSRQITFITLTAPGAALDVVARTIANGLQEQTGQPVVVVNRTGAGGNIGAGEIARAAPDGYTIGMITTSTHGINPSFMPAMPFDPIKDFAPITMAAELNILLNVHADSPARSLKDFVALSKAKPGTVTFGSAGAGTALHMVGELIRAKTGLDMTHGASTPLTASARSAAVLASSAAGNALSRASQASASVRVFTGCCEVRKSGTVK